MDERLQGRKVRSRVQGKIEHSLGGLVDKFSVVEVQTNDLPSP